MGVQKMLYFHTLIGLPFIHKPINTEAFIIQVCAAKQNYLYSSLPNDIVYKIYF